MSPREGISAIDIRVTEDDQLHVHVNLSRVQSTLRAGVMLACATRVIAEAMVDFRKDKEGMGDQILTAISETYNKDLVMGGMGEKESLQAVDEDEG